MTKRVAYSKEMLRPLIAESFSLAEVIRKIGLVPKGGSYETLKRKIIQFDLNTSHFTGQLWNKGLTAKDPRVFRGVAKNTKHTSESLRDGINLGSATLRKLLRESGVVEKCQKCGCESVWQGEPIRLQMDHINGNSFDNRIENIRFLCPNCHSQTTTFGRKNSFDYRAADIPVHVPIEKEKPKKRTLKPTRYCGVCETSIRNGRFCSYSCSAVGTRKCALDDREIFNTLAANDFNYSKTSREIGISDNAIRKRLRKARLSCK